MLVRLLVPRATVQGPQQAGLELDLDPAAAERLVAAGQAEIVRQKTPQRAVRKPRVEKATK